MLKWSLEDYIMLEKAYVNYVANTDSSSAL